MKQVALFVAALLACYSASGQGRFFNTGDSYAYEFTNLSLSLAHDPCVCSAGLFALNGENPSIFQPGNSLRVELFETSINDAPFATSILTQGPGQQVLALGVWQDLQGVVRLTMDSGSATIDEFAIQVWRDDGPPGSSLYTEHFFLPTNVPEPSIWTLFGAGALFLYCLRRNTTLPTAPTNGGITRSC